MHPWNGVDINGCKRLSEIEDEILFRTVKTLFDLRFKLLPYLIHGAESFLRSWPLFRLVKKFPAYYGARRCITAVTSARHLFLSCASSIQFIPPHPTSWRSIFSYEWTCPTRLLTFHVPTLWSLFHCSGRTKGSVQTRGTRIRFAKRAIFTVRSL